ncbi:MAG: DUF1641 domain-containing protein [Acidobacteriota bacterium]
MAQPITFKPRPVDEKLELQRRVAEAPEEHAEALLGAWDLLQAAHEQGVLDLAQGLIGGRDAIAGKLAEAAKEPESIVALRNLIALGRLLGSVDPEMLQRVAREAKLAAVEEPPSLWQIFRRVASKDGRRGLAMAANLLTGFGRASRGSKHD